MVAVRSSCEKKHGFCISSKFLRYWDLSTSHLPWKKTAFCCPNTLNPPAPPSSMVKKLNAFTPSSRALVKLQAFQRNRSNLRDSPKRLGRWQVIWLGHKGQAFRRNAQPIKHGLSVIFFHKEKWTSKWCIALLRFGFWTTKICLKQVLRRYDWMSMVFF